MTENPSEIKDCIDGLRDLESREFTLRSDGAGFILLESARYLELLCEDLRVTNALADFHVKECRRLRAALEEAKRGYKEIKDLLNSND